MDSVCVNCESRCSYPDKVEESKLIIPKNWSKELTEYGAVDSTWVFAMEMYRKGIADGTVPDSIMDVLDTHQDYNMMFSG